MRKILLFFYLLQFSLNLGRNQTCVYKKKETRRFIFLYFLFLFFSQTNKNNFFFLESYSLLNLWNNHYTLTSIDNEEITILYIRKVKKEKPKVVNACEPKLFGVI